MSLVKINSIRISLEANSNLMALEGFKESWKYKEQIIAPAMLDSMRKIRIIESAGASNRIEGNTLSDKEVEELLQGLKQESFKSRDEEEVVGYSEVLDTIYNNCDLLSFLSHIVVSLRMELLLTQDT